ncbi:MAG: hypothetical protein FE047_02290 [Thermoplasmata archaeon]|nr:MAG: hypothetical protein FE047_02290 [Thermoplasmata archaeon]KAA0015119.1 MAG: hypothetical protein FE041_00900 [Thermoplasmata archaeon]OYT61073.1 MAG: hypothetical protein B6U81_03950 [Thermoplasmatales archaeon ex4484_30]
MPHQCLKCGKIYKDSRYVLDGCPECGGKSFYYTKKPLDEEKRKEILKEMEHEGAIEVEGEKLENILLEIKRKKEEARKEAEKMKERVESIDVKDMGEYEINVMRLLEEGVIIVHKEGAYFIYLPSLFKWKK